MTIFRASAVFGCLLLPAVIPLRGVEQTYHLHAGDMMIEIIADSFRLERRFGPRFDSTASVASVSTPAHTYLAEAGLADEFGLEGVGVLGYREASLGGSFIKIGVGLLKRDVETKYRFQHSYPVVRRFPVKVEATDASVQMTQVSEPFSGYQYRYEKTYRPAGSRGLVIEYVLTNLGSKRFSFEHYNHNFFAFDGEGGSENYTVTAAFSWPAEPAAGWRLDGRKRLVLSSQLTGLSGVYWGVPVEIAASQHRLILQHRKGIAVVITGDSDATRFAIWADGGAICPELFIHRELSPGDTARWTRTYHFVTATPMDGTVLRAGSRPSAGRIASDKNVRPGGRCSVRAFSPG